MLSLEIKGKLVGPSHKPFTILEAGINHNGDMAIVKDMIAVAAEAGADAIKFQTFKAKDFVSDERQTYTYISQGKEVTESMVKMFERYELAPKEWEHIFNWCEGAGIICFSTPQNISDLEYLQSIVELPAIKIGSDDLTNVALIKRYAQAQLPLILSAGMAYLSEIDEAVRTVQSSGNSQLALMHCVSSYPTSPEELNLGKIVALQKAFDIPIGFSDHTVGCNAVVGAVIMGACIVEKHFTLDKNLPGPDHRFSADPAEAKNWVTAAAEAFLMKGCSTIGPTAKELEMRTIARRSVVAARDLRTGEVIEQTDITFMRPGTGLMPSLAPHLIGQKVARTVMKNQLLTFDDIRG
jgi:sialic acid synthase SpsE